MIVRSLLVILLFVISSDPLMAQKASIQALLLTTAPNEKVDSSVQYPVISTGNAAVDGPINSAILAGLTDVANTDSTVLVMNEWIADGLANMSYETSFNKNGILSLAIFVEGCGAYCSSSTQHFNFDLRTGNRLDLADLIRPEKFETFCAMLETSKAAQLAEYKLEKTRQLENSTIDSVTYSWCMDEIAGFCAGPARLDNFCITANGIQVFDDCEFPHAIRPESPDIELIYRYREIPELFKRSFRKIWK